MATASDFNVKRDDSKSEIVSAASPAKKGPPRPPVYSSKDKDPRSEIVFYNYDDSDVEDDSDGMHEFTDKEFEEYSRQLDESDGFDVMSFPRSFACGGTTPVYNLHKIADKLRRFSELALKQYNENENINLEFVKVVKANKAGCAGIMYYITFDVKDADAVDDRRTREFQACVWDGIGHTTVLISRLKEPEKKQTMDEGTKLPSQAQPDGIFSVGSLYMWFESKLGQKLAITKLI